MARQCSSANRAQVNRTVTYWAAGRDSRPAIITAVAGTVVSLRVGHHGETYTNVPMRVNRTDTNVWSTW